MPVDSEHPDAVEGGAAVEKPLLAWRLGPLHAGVVGLACALLLAGLLVDRFDLMIAGCVGLGGTHAITGAMTVRDIRRGAREFDPGTQWWSKEAFTAISIGMGVLIANVLATFIPWLQPDRTGIPEMDFGIAALTGALIVVVCTVLMFCSWGLRKALLSWLKVVPARAAEPQRLVAVSARALGLRGTTSMLGAAAATLVALGVQLADDTLLTIAVGIFAAVLLAAWRKHVVTARDGPPRHFVR